MLPEVSKVLFVRTDKIGDVVLTTPAIAAFRKKFPKSHLVGLVAPGSADIYRSNPHLDNTLVLDPNSYSGILGFFRLVEKLRQEKFGAAIVFQAHAFVGFALLFSGIRFRVGPYSKWWSWFCFNYGRRQSRSAVEMHEAQYNIQLLRDFRIFVADSWEKTILGVDNSAKNRVQAFFMEKGLSPKHKTVVIHPGMAGSALNWPEGHYTALARRLVRHYNVILTGGPGESALVERVFQGVARHQTFAPSDPVFTKYLGQNGLAELIALLDRCDGVVAPSTGPMHLAVALGKKVVTVFSPIKVQSAVRWGPYGVSLGSNLGVAAGDGAAVLVPDVNCGEDFRCALSACIYYPCMPRISVDDVETELRALLEGIDVELSRGPPSASQDWEDTEETE